MKKTCKEEMYDFYRILMKSCKKKTLELIKKSNSENDIFEIIGKALAGTLANIIILGIPLENRKKMLNIIMKDIKKFPGFDQENECPTNIEDDENP